MEIITASTSDYLPCGPTELMHVKVLDMGFPGGSVVKNPLANTGDMGLIPGLRRSPGEENGYPLQYSCPRNPKDRDA